ncbi:single-strand DNA-binding protein [Calothrix parasitica NIES-267]|uniref:Single-strand DNA-binding protein n=1 Tax=Calothrix parasitica NIES-267 TaxID=1973488 RepID=A0A1Z4LYP4_9CYAN|nr:single-strand DNA-binding protein [Calothrix parasitica NIES-267]
MILVGYAAQQPELRYFDSGKILCKFPIIIQSLSDAGKNSLESIDLELWDIAAQYIPKGREIGIVGSLKFYNWKDRKTGTLRQSTTVLVSQLHLLGAFMKVNDQVDINDNEEYNIDYDYQEDYYEDCYSPYEEHDDSMEWDCWNDMDYGYLDDLHDVYEHLH